MAHQEQPRRVKRGADPHHAHHTEAVSDRAGNRLPQSPKQVLHSKREAEDIAPPTEFAAHRLDEETKTGARPETQQRDRTAADDDHQRCTPTGRGPTLVDFDRGHANLLKNCFWHAKPAALYLGDKQINANACKSKRTGRYTSPSAIEPCAFSRDGANEVMSWT